MKQILSRAIQFVALLALAGCGVLSAPQSTLPLSTQPAVQPTSTTSKATPELAGKAPPTVTPPPTPTSTAPRATPSQVPTLSPTTSTVAPADPFELVSLNRLLGYLQDLTSIQPYSGWRNSASKGEAEALEYVSQKLGGLAYLDDFLGLELESQSFRVFLGTELWESRVELTVNGESIEVPADGLRGPRDDLTQALRFDSDGALNDSDPNPRVAEGSVLTIRSADEIQGLNHDDLRDKVVFLDYAAIDRSVMETKEATDIATALLAERPTGLVLVTTFSNELHESHGAFVGDNSALNWVKTDSPPPILYVRLEDLAQSGIGGWEDLEQIESARLTWDADVFSPAISGNLVARIPGADPTRAVILGAHIDSPNSPGAMDDGSGSAVLLEVARVLNDAAVQPPTDLYLAWFGSEELGLYGASNFVATHQDLLDRTQAMLQIDCLTRPLDGLRAELKLVSWPYGRLGDDRLLWPEYLSEAVRPAGIETQTQVTYYVYSDNSAFGGFDVPHADLIYEPLVDATTSVHYAGHLHDPYDTVELASDVGDTLEQMARVALTAALDAGPDAGGLRVTPQSDRRALFVASHTEPPHMTPVTFTEMGMAMALEGFDVDLVPYGQPVTTDALQDADLVVVLPVLDYPGEDSDPEMYDEAWTPEEIAALETYAAEGGLLVLTNSAHRLKYGSRGLDWNEDWDDANALATRFGITYLDGTVLGNQASAVSDHPLLADATSLELGWDNGIPFSFFGPASTQVLAEADGQPVVALVDFGEAGGQVIALADVGMLTTAGGEPHNLTFWRNLARYAR